MKLEQPHRTCPVCRSGDGAEVLHTQEFTLAEGHMLPEKYDVVACGACGCVYADAAASQRTFDDYYAQMSKYEADYTGKDAAMFADRAAWIGAVVGDTQAAIVDVGCGNGLLLLELRDIGFRDMLALDPSADCTRAIRAQGIDGRVGSLLTVAPTRRFDGLILSGVLEHLWDAADRVRRECDAIAIPADEREYTYEAPFTIQTVGRTSKCSFLSYLGSGSVGTGNRASAWWQHRYGMEPEMACAYDSAGGVNTPTTRAGGFTSRS